MFLSLRPFPKDFAFKNSNIFGYHANFIAKYKLEKERKRISKSNSFISIILHLIRFPSHGTKHGIKLTYHNKRKAIKYYSGIQF